MRTKELDYCLPKELIAQQPARARADSRLLVLDRRTGRLEDSRFTRIAEFLQRGDCLVLNDTKVLPARFYARRSTGGKLQGLFLSQREAGLWEVMLKGAGKINPGEHIRLKAVSGDDFCRAEMSGRTNDGKLLLRVDAPGDADDILAKIGFPPLPPYIKRDADLHQAAKDKIRYQTVYARNSGAVAAPTAGLHFTKKLLGQLESRGIKVACVTLHVGEGTFKPVTADALEKHKMHYERFCIDQKNASIINDAKQAGGRIIAVGTTSVRTLEAAAKGQTVEATQGRTDLFIVPGYKFKIVDAMITNFHLPKSTLLALVAAFAGLDRILAAYRHAVEQQYRFYSYGDAMMIR